MSASSSSTPTLVWDTTFQETFGNITSPAFLTPLTPTPLQTPSQWVHYNTALAQQLGLPLVKDTTLLNALSGNSVLPNSTPYAVVYAGHQFGHYVPQLGDGRATTVGTLSTPTLGLQELQLKGAGQTPYSRMGDGRAVLRSSIREYLCSEAMHQLGIPTTRALSLVTALDEPIYRESVEPAGIVCRVAPSFLRFGTVQFWEKLGRTDVLDSLISFVLTRYYPEYLTAENPVNALVLGIIERTATLIAHWQSVGFCHGVMNTDNMSLLCLTLDYGPFGFLDAFNPAHICNHSDYHGRYAYHQQPTVGQWNCIQFVRAMKPCLPELAQSSTAWEAFEEHCLYQYEQTFYQAFTANYAQKLGLPKASVSAALLKPLFSWMAQAKVDYTNTFRTFSQWQAQLCSVTSPLTQETVQAWLQTVGANETLPASTVATVTAWMHQYQTILLEDTTLTSLQRAIQMNETNPKYVLRNYLLQQAIEQAEAGDFSAVETLFTIVQTPFAEHPEYSSHYAQQPPAWAAGLCISCSS